MDIEIIQQEARKKEAEWAAVKEDIYTFLKKTCDCSADITMEFLVKNYRIERLNP